MVSKSNDPIHIRMYLGKQFKYAMARAVAHGLTPYGEAAEWKFRITPTSRGKTYYHKRKITVPEHAVVRGRDYALAYLLHELAHVFTHGHGHDETFHALEERMLSWYDLEIVRRTKGIGSKAGYADDILVAGESVNQNVPVKPTSALRLTEEQRQAVADRLQGARAKQLGLTLEQYRMLKLRPGRKPTEADIERVRVLDIQAEKEKEFQRIRELVALQRWHARHGFGGYPPADIDVLRDKYRRMKYVTGGGVGNENIDYLVAEALQTYRDMERIYAVGDPRVMKRLARERGLHNVPKLLAATKARFGG